MVTAREFWRSTVNDFNPLGPRPEDVASFSWIVTKTIQLAAYSKG